MTSRLLLLALPLLAGCKDGKDSTDSGGDEAGPSRLTVLHTNDLHSHLLGFGPEAEYTPESTGDDTTVGGLARVAALVDQIRGETDHPVLLLDAGDFEEGTLFQLLETTDAPEMQLFGAMGYDAITIGNHEFSWGPGHLADLIATADAKGVTVPILSSNMVTDPTSPDDDGLEDLVASGRIVPTLVLTQDDGLKVGLFGVLGAQAASVAPAKAPVTFTPIDEASASAVDALRAEGVDIVIAVSHSGVTDDPTTSPDELLAAAVPGIDVIVGGHSHTLLSAVRTAGDDATPIVQAGAYGEFLGQLDLVRADDGTWQVESYQVHPIDDTIAGDATVQGLVDSFVDALDAGPLSALGYSYDTPVAHVPAEMPALACEESGLGDFVTDAFRDRMTVLGGEPVDFAFESQGVIRDGLSAGSSGIASFADAFRVLPLGSGTDDVPGYGLVHFWVTASEIIDACEVTASVSPSYGCDYFIEVSGLRCNLDFSHGSFNRARSADRWTGTAWEPLDPMSDQLYHIAVDSYVASLMGMLESLTYGAIIITPKDREGKPYTSTTDMLFDADPATGVQELKLWQALIDYAATFEDADGDGVPDIPADYSSPAGRYTGWK